jgi:hypothetical protein
MQKPLVVGIDIGLTTGVAVFDLNKNLLFVGSKRYYSTSDLIKHILSFGRPIMIATDKKRIPPKINRIASSLNCKVFKPDHDLSVKEKERIVNISVKSPHERDALASALFFFKTYASVFNKIDRMLSSMKLKAQKEAVKEMIITKRAKNISEAIEKLGLKKEKVKVKEKVREIHIDWKKKAEEYERELKEERKRYEILKIYCEKIEEKLKDLEEQKKAYLEEEMRKNEEMRRKVIKEREIRKRDMLIKQLKFEVGRLKNLLRSYEEEFERQRELKDIEDSDLAPITIIKDLKKESVLEAEKRFGVKNRIVWVKGEKRSKAGAKLLVSLKPKVVIGSFESPLEDILRSSGVIIVNNLEPKVKKYYAYLPYEKLKNAIKMKERESFLEWLEDYRRRRI